MMVIVRDDGCYHLRCILIMIYEYSSCPHVLGNHPSHLLLISTAFSEYALVSSALSAV